VLLDIGSVLGGVGLAVIGFVVVILVCVVILRLLAAILPSYEDRSTGADADPADHRPTDEETSPLDAATEPSVPAAGASPEDASTVASADPETVD
jgi:hypothetical protein